GPPGRRRLHGAGQPAGAFPGAVLGERGELTPAGRPLDQRALAHRDTAKAGPHRDSERPHPVQQARHLVPDAADHGRRGNLAGSGRGCGVTYRPVPGAGRCHSVTPDPSYSAGVLPVNLTLMAGRPLHALLLPPAAGAGRLLDALAAALDGSGPAILPLDPGLPSARVDDLLHAFTPATVETLDGEERWRPDDSRPAAPGTGADPPDGTAVVIATSGSTGEPKGAQLSADALLASARASLDRIGARPGARRPGPLLTSHIAGVGVLVRFVVSGMAPVVVDRLDPAQRNLAAYGCGYVSLVPAQLRRMLEAGAGLSAFEAILLGGAGIPSGLLTGA